MEQRPEGASQQMFGDPGVTWSQPAISQPVTAPPVPVGPVVVPSIDRFPKSPADWAAFARLSAADRSAAYLRSIRSMVLFFTVLTIIGITLSIILAVLGIAAIDQQQSTFNTIGG